MYNLFCIIAISIQFIDKFAYFYLCHRAGSNVQFYVCFCISFKENNLDPQKQAVLCDLSSFGHISIINAVDVSSSAGLCVNMVKRKFFKALLFIYHFKYGKFLKSAFYL